MKEANFLVEWEALEFSDRQRHPNWFWIVGGAIIVLTLVSIFLQNFFFAILLLVGGFTLLMYAAKKPNTIHLAITRRGLKVHNSLYPYGTLHSFTIHEEHPAGPRIVVHARRILIPMIVMPLARHLDTDEIRGHLVNFLPEEKRSVSPIDVIAEYLEL